MTGVQTCALPIFPSHDRPRTGKFTPGWNKGLTKNSSEGMRKLSEKLKGKGNIQALNKWITSHREEHLEACRRGGLKSYREDLHVGHCKGEWREDSYGKVCYLQSSFESKMADILDKFQIKWVRPKPMGYQINGVHRRCFIDFFLPELDLYADPKDPPIS